MNQKDVIYLNQRTYEGSDYCVLYFKSNEVLLDRIANNSWIKWHPEMKAYTTPIKHNTIGLLQDVFEDIAHVSTKYYQAEIKGNTEKTVIGDTVYFKGILEPKNKVGSICWFLTRRMMKD